MPGFLHVFGDEIRKGGQDLGGRHPVANHLDNRVVSHVIPLMGSHGLS